MIAPVMVCVYYCAMEYSTVYGISSFWYTKTKPTGIPMSLRTVLQSICEELYNSMPAKMHHRKAPAIFKKVIKEVNTTFSSSATVHTVAENGQTLAFYIAREGMPSVLQTALDLKSDVYHRDLHGRTLLHGACECRSVMMMSDGDPVPTVDLLLNHIDINTPDNNGNTPLFDVGFMVRENTADFGDPLQAMELAHFIEHLIARGADIHHKNHKGHTFVHRTLRLPKHLRAVFDPYRTQIEHKTLTDAIGPVAPRSNRTSKI